MSNLLLKMNKSTSAKLNHLQESIVHLKQLHLSLLKNYDETVRIIPGIIRMYDAGQVLLRTRGQVGFLDYWKESRLAFLCFLAGNRYKPKDGVWIARRKDCCPKIVGHSLYDECKRGNKDVIRNVLTAMFLSRNLPLDGSPADYSAITEGSSPELPRSMISWMRLHCKRKR